jgi:hypothetical protein
MLNRNKMWTLPAVLGVALLAATAAPQLRASGYNDNITKVTFSGPVDIGNVALAPGTYVFKTLPGNNVDRSLVEVMDQNNQHLITLVQAIPAVAPVPLGESRIDLAEGPANAPEHVKAWYYPDQYQGWEFLPLKPKK